MTEPPAPAVPDEARRAARARRRRLARIVKRAAYGLVGLTIVGGLVVAWIPRPVPVELATAERAELRVTVDEDGVARVKDRYVVSAPIAGSLARLQLSAGDDVKGGDALARIVPLAPPLLDQRTRDAGTARVQGALAAQEQARVLIERNQVGLDLARNEIERVRVLAQKGAATRQQLDDAVLHERRARAELESARFAAQVANHEVAMTRASLARLRPGAPARGEELVVPSPVSGRILKLHRESEGAVQAGAPLLEIGDPAALEVVVDVLTVDAVRVHPGARVRLDRWGGAPLDGQVRIVEPSAFSRVSALGVDEQRVNVVIDLTSPRPAWATLGDGYRVEAQIVVWESADVLQVPATALFRHGDGWAVFVEEGGRARRRAVEPGERGAHAVEIRRGLVPGARVLVHPSDRVTDGARVAG